MPEVIGAIRDRWVQLGAENSYLRNPVTDEMDFGEEGGRVSAFEGGAIYWWPDLGAVDMGEMFVHFTGLRCFDRTAGGGSDEPYVVIGVSAPNREDMVFRSQIFGDVDAGSVRADSVQLYRGVPAGLTIAYTMLERDAGNPDDYMPVMKAVASGITAAAAEGVKFIPKIGPILSKGVNGIAGLVAGPIADGLSNLLGLGDDRIGAGSFTWTPKEMVRIAIQPNIPDGPVLFKFVTPELTESSGRYVAYFGGVKTP